MYAIAFTLIRINFYYYGYFVKIVPFLSSFASFVGDDLDIKTVWWTEDEKHRSVDVCNW